MAIEKIVNITINENFKPTIDGVNNLDGSLKKLDKSTKSLGHGMKGAGNSALEFASNSETLNNITGGLGDTISTVAGNTGVFSTAITFITGAQALYTTVIGTSTGALKAFKTALISTGIGAVVILISALVVAMDNMESSTKKAERAQKLLNDEIERSNDLLKEELSSVEYVTKARLLRAEKLGASEKELQKIEQSGSNERLKAIKDEENRLLALQKQKNLTPEAQAKINELLIKNTASFNKEIQNQELGRLTSEKDNANKSREIAKDAEEKRIKDSEKAREKQKAIDAKIAEDRKKLAEENLKAQNEFQIAVNNAEFEQRLIDEENQRARLDSITAFIDEKDRLEKEASEREIEREQIVADAKLDIQNYTLDNISDGIDLLKQLAGKSKALQIASLIAESAVGVSRIIINTRSANAIAKASPINLADPTYGIRTSILNNISAGIGIASNLVALKSGLSALGGGGGQGAPSTGGNDAQSAPPQFNIVGQNSNNQLAQTIGTQQNRPIEAFVVSGNVTNAQQLDRNRINTATFGS